MILERGNKVLVVHRRLFETDRPRFFLGVVDDYEGGIAKVTGHTWLENIAFRRVIKKEGARTKILSILSGSLIVYQLPEVELNSIKFEYDDTGRLWMKAGANLNLDMSEFEYQKQQKQAS